MKATRLLSALLIVALLPLDVLAMRNTGEDVLNVGKPGSTANKELRLGTGKIFYEPSVGKLKFTNDGTIFKEVGSGSGSGSGIVLNGNTGFEDGLDQWTFTPGTASITNSDKAFGNNAMVFAPTAAGQYLRGQGIAVPKGLENKACTLSWHYTGGAANVVARVWNGTSAVATSPVLGNITGSWSAKRIFAFTCGAAGSIMYPEFFSLGADSIKVDDVKLGQEIIQNPAPQGGQYVGEITFPACQFTRGSVAGVGDYSVQTSCTPVVSTDSTPELAAPATLSPGMTLNPDASYVYSFRVTGANGFTGNSGQSSVEYYLGDGTTQTYAGQSSVVFLSAAGSYRFPYINVDYKPTSSGARQVRLQAFVSSNNANVAILEGLKIAVYKYPKAVNVNASQGISVDSSGWRVDGTIGGANPFFSTTNNFVPFSIAGLSMQLDEGSFPAEITCGTAASTGLTCASGTSQTGLAFNIPEAGDYEACGTGGTYINMNTANSLTYTTAWFETPNAADTILREGGNKLSTSWGGPTAQAMGGNFTNCSTFRFNEAGKKTLKFGYTYAAGNIISANLYADRTTANGAGGRSFRFSIRRKVANADVVKVETPKSAVLSANMTTGERIDRLQTNGTCAIAGQSGPFSLKTGTATHTGCRYSLPLGYYSATPTCTCNANNDQWCVVGVDVPPTSSTPAELYIFTRYVDGTGRNSPQLNVICMGPR